MNVATRAKRRAVSEVAVPRSPHPRKGFGPVEQRAERLGREIEQLRAERDGDVRAVAALAAAEDGEPLDRAISNLIARFADRIEALDADANGDAQ